MNLFVLENGEVINLDQICSIGLRTTFNAQDQLTARLSDNNDYDITEADFQRIKEINDA